MTTLTAPARVDVPRSNDVLRGVARSTRAELLRLRKWPALWLTIGVELLLNVLFIYVFNYVSYRSSGDSGISEGVPKQVLLERMLPAAIPSSGVAGMPMFAGALVLILGALMAGSGYGWGTVKTVALQGPGRLTSLTGSLAALLTAVVGLVVALFATDVAVSLAVATSESRSVVWPALSDLVTSLGGGVLIMGAWALAGVLVGTLARSPALSVGLGLVWVLAIENLLRGVGEIWSPLQHVTDLLPGTAAGSLAGALGAVPVTDPGGTPGVLTTLGGTSAAALLAAYVVMFVGATAALVRRRDVT
jgi:ABC-2 type transport system permease protein